jgi:hypothetical protein
VRGLGNLVIPLRRCAHELGCSSYRYAQPNAQPDALPNAQPDALPDAIPNALPDAIPNALPNALPDAIPNAIPNVWRNNHPNNSTHQMRDRRYLAGRDRGRRREL